MISLVRLKTKGMFADRDPKDPDFELWQKITDFMDGENAWVMKSLMDDGRYLFLSLDNEEKWKELSWMMEQDSMTGVYIDDREGFEKVWDAEEYERELLWYLESEHLEFLLGGDEE